MRCSNRIGLKIEYTCFLWKKFRNRKNFINACALSCWVSSVCQVPYIYIIVAFPEIKVLGAGFTFWLCSGFYSHIFWNFFPFLPFGLGKSVKECGWKLWVREEREKDKLWSKPIPLCYREQPVGRSLCTHRRPPGYSRLKLILSLSYNFFLFQW